MKAILLFALAAQAAGSGELLSPEAKAEVCAGAAEQRAALTAEKQALDRTIGDIALGKAPKKKRKADGGDVARGVAGTAASILLPFPIGLALNAGASAAAKAGRKKGAPADPGPDVAAMIDRLGEIGARLERLKACP